ncbi:SLAP domain-containing protein [Lactobacillus amylovorus]
MKKNLRIISVAAAALLAVAPVATSVVPTVGANVVQAADNTITGSVVNNSNAATGNIAANQGTTTNIANAPTNRPFFARNYEAIGEATTENPNANVVRQTVSIKVGETADDIAKDLKNLKIVFHPSVSDTKTTAFAPSADEVVKLLNNVTFETPKSGANKGKQVVKTLPNGDFNLTITGQANNQTAAIQIPFVVSSSSSATDTTGNPVISYTVAGQAGKNPVFQVAANSQFNPLDFTNAAGDEVKFSAVQASGSSIQASLTATSNPVDTSQQGRFYNVTLTATNLNGRTSTFTYTVLITSSQKQTLYGNGTINTYNIYGNNALNGSTTFKSGDTVYVADATKTINGVSYSQVSIKSKADAATSNIWVKTADLTKPATPSDTNVKTYPVMIDSRAYDKNGNYLGHMYYAYDNIDVVPTVVTINGKTYYKVANKDEYVRVTNITGNKRTLTHNAYIYWSSYRRTPGTGKMYKGQTVTTYGPAMRFKNGKKYYRIEGCRNNNKRYIKAANLSAAQ